MKVVILKGSPRGRRSDPSKIADAFAEGARAAGHEVSVFDAGRASARP